jgi:adenosylcobinamide kinase/adenosylcobinamide-phosphate guanylyltransferase
MGKVVFVTGGSRSGKTAFALREGAEAAGPGRKVYIATAQALDAEMAERIGRHRKERGSAWETVEEPVHLERAVRGCAAANVMVIDCLTLWLSNLVCGGFDVEEAQAGLVAALGALDGPVHAYVVSNEVGMGIVPENDMARLFRDMAGRLNQAVARLSDEAYLMVSGLSVKVK